MTARGDRDQGLVTAVPGGVQLRVRVIPRASRTEVAGIRDGALLVRLTAPPVEGAANDALVRVLAGMLGVPTRSVTLVAGQRSRTKCLALAGVTRAEVEAAIAGLTPG